jgi:hypothetical protein
MQRTATGGTARHGDHNILGDPVRGQIGDRLKDLPPIARRAHRDGETSWQWMQAGISLWAIPNTSTGR